jgi:CheY-like chemotaxis protein
VATAANLGEVDALGVEPFVALVDLRVPGGGFGESLERVRVRFPGTPTVVITAYAEGEVNCTALFQKPFDTGELVAQVEALYQAAIAP